MRLMPYLVKNDAGNWCVQRKVPSALQALVAQIENRKRKTPKARQVYLRRSLGTDNKREATHRAKHALAELDQILSEARARANQLSPARRDSLNAAEITRMSEAFYAKMLADDEASRFGGRAYVAQSVEWIRRNENPEFELPYPLESVPEFGWSPEELAFQKAREAEELETMREALACGDITAVVDDVWLLLANFNIDLDRSSASYRQLGTAVLRAYVRGLEAIAKRSAGEVIETPKTPLAPAAPTSSPSASLREALEGWKKERVRPEDGVHEYTRAVEMFIELHGNLAIADIKRSHASQFRDALRLVPKTRKGKLLKAGLRELRQWGEEHPSAPKVSAATVNKQLGAVQAIISWGYRHGLVPDDVPQTDPFKDMRVEGEKSTRDAFDPHGLQAIFDAPLFTEQKVPAGGKGPAAVWLPLLAVFMGGRQNEFASLRVSEIREDVEMHIPLMWITRDATAGKNVKTDAGERVVPIHPQIIQLGFLEYVAQRKAEDGDKAWLFPAVSPDQRGGRKAWAKWWGRYLRDHIGLEDRSLVFHSFRHGFQDALRRATPDEELRDALAGRSSAGKSISRGYGAKQMLQRWGVQRLHETICNVSFPGLDLSRVEPLGKSTTSRENKRK
jgi:hypothetical protein